jgi:hypothetical protein
VTGTFVILRSLLKVAISPASNGRGRTVATGIVIHVLMLLKVTISPASNGRERMDVQKIEDENKY